MLKLGAILFLTALCSLASTSKSASLPRSIPPPTIPPVSVGIAGSGSTRIATINVKVIRDGASGNFVLTNGLSGPNIAKSRISIEFPSASKTTPYTYQLTSSDVDALNQAASYDTLSFAVPIGEDPSDVAHFVVRCPVYFSQGGNVGPCVDTLTVDQN